MSTPRKRQVQATLKVIDLHGVCPVSHDGLHVLASRTNSYGERYDQCALCPYNTLPPRGVLPRRKGRTRGR